MFSLLKSENKYSNRTEYLLALCISKIEKELKLGEAKNWSTRDFEDLSQLIQNKTKVYISTSTLKRIWNKQFNNTPQKATLDALAMFIGYENWLDFTLKNIQRVKNKRISLRFLLFLAVSVIISIIGFLYFLKVRQTSILHESKEIVVKGSEKNTIITTHDDSVIVVGKPIYHSNLIKGDIGWNAELKIDDNDFLLKEKDFIFEDVLNIQPFLKSLNLKQINEIGLNYYYICQQAEVPIEKFSLRSIFSNNEKKLSLGFIIELYTIDNDLKIDLNLKENQCRVFIDDSLQYTSASAFDVKNMSNDDIKIELETNNKELLLSTNSNTLLNFPNFELEGSIIAFVLKFKYPVILSDFNFQEQ